MPRPTWPARNSACSIFAVPQRVHAQLAEHQRLVADQVLQPEQVAAERLPVVQVDVERGEVEERQVEVLGRRDSWRRSPGSGIGLPDHVMQLGQEPLDPARPVPADDVGRDLVADAVGQHASMVAARTALRSRTASRACCWAWRLSRKQRCLGQGTSTNTRDTCSSARWKNHAGVRDRCGSN